MRLFIAVKPDRKTLDTLVMMQEKMKKQGVYGNYTSLQNLHITLAFIGEYDKPQKALEAMKTVRFPPFELSVKGIGSFGELYFADMAVSDNLKEYVTDLRAALDKAGVPYDRKKFTPHITLLRRASKPVVRNISVQSEPMTADSVLLMRSDRGERGMIYTPVGSVSGEKNQGSRDMTGYFGSFMKL